MKIAIIGCGIAGLAVANFLARDDNSVTIFEQFEKQRPVGSGLVIQPVGLRILEKLSAASDALEKGAPGYTMLGIETEHKRKILDVSYGPKGGANFGLGIHRASLFDALLKACARYEIHIVPSHHLTESHIKDQYRYLTFSNGKTKGPYDLVIDTSGANSIISPLKARILPYGALWGTVDWAANTPLKYNRLEQRYRQARNMVGILPIGCLPDDNTRKATLFWSLSAQDHDKWVNTPLEAWKDQVLGMWPEIQPFLDQIEKHDDMTMARYSHGTLYKPYSERLVHIGDAAHRASPQLGQGANMALLDAYALAQCIKHYPLDQALKTYVKSRKLHTLLYQSMSWAFTPMYQSNSRVLPLLRDRVFAPISTIPPVQKLLTSLVKGTLIPPYTLANEG